MGASWLTLEKGIENVGSPVWPVITGQAVRILELDGKLVEYVLGIGPAKEDIARLVGLYLHLLDVSL